MARWLAGSAIALLASACGPGGAPGAARSVPELGASTAIVSAADTTRLTLALPDGGAPWLESAPAAAVDALGAAEPPREVAAHISLFKTAAGWFVGDDRRGVAGPLHPPSGALWIGVGGGDRVLAALPGGALVGADVDDAIRGAFRPLGEVAGAQIWDAAGDVVAAGTSWDELQVSSDGGRTFVKGSLGGDRQITGVWARADGVVVARARPVGGGDEVTFVSRAGRRWARSRYQPASLEQTGSWIWSGSADCAVVLSRDGARWVEASIVPIMAARDRWTRMLARTDTATGSPPGDRLTIADPPAPPPPPRRATGVAGKGGCENLLVPPGLERELSMEMIAPEPIRVGCRGLDCLRDTPGPAPEPTAAALHLVSDGVCAAEHADDARVCRSGTAFSSLPHAMRHDRAELLPLPAGCAPVRALSARGLGLLVCGAERATIHAVDGSLRWHREAELDAPAAALTALTMADDGTIVIALPCAATAPCRAFARRPVAAGAEGAWRDVSVAGAMTYRAVAGGSALAVAAVPRDLLAFVVDSPGSGQRKLAVMKRPPPNIQQLAVTRRGFIAITVREGRHLILYHLGRDGTLVP